MNFLAWLELVGAGFSGQRWKTNEIASNARVNLFLARVKSVPNFTLFCRKNDLYPNLALCRLILLAFNLVSG